MNRVRRSWMVVPAHQPRAIERAREYLPDVLVLDLEYTVPPKDKERARQSLPGRVRNLYRTYPDLFVRVDWQSRWADIRSAVYPGLTGFVLPGPEQVEEIKELDELVTKMEHERGVIPDSLEFVLILESAKGFWNALDLAQASPRISALGIGRIDLTMELGPEPSGDFRLSKFLMARTLTAARAFGLQPLGAHFVASSRGGDAPADATLKAAIEGWQMGFTGCIAATPEQVSALNKGFTPSADYVKKTEAILGSYEASDESTVDIAGVLYDENKALRVSAILAYAAACEAHDKAKSSTLKQVTK